MEDLLAIAVFYSAFSVGFFVRERMAALTGTSCGHGMEKTCAGLLMASTSADLILTDPPYNVNVTETAGRHGVGEGGRAGQHEFDFLAGFDLVAAHDGHASSVFRTP